MKIGTLVFGMLLLPLVSHADYRARCLGADGKQVRCRIAISGDAVKIRLGMRSDITIRGQEITSLTMEHATSPEAQKNFLQGAGIAIPAEGLTVVVPLATETADDALIGLQYEISSGTLSESQPATMPATQTVSKQAILIQIDAKSAAGFKLQLETLSGKKFERGER